MAEKQPAKAGLARAHPHSLAARASGADRLIGPVLVLATVLLVLGWTLPIMTVERFLFLSERVSILEGCLALWAEGHYFLFAVITLFSVVFPLIKLSLALFLWNRADAGSPDLGRSLGWVERLGRWSMLDVFAVALVVVAVQLSIVSDVSVHAGIYVFTVAILLSMLTVHRISTLARRAEAAGEDRPEQR